jgi:tetratricopeptide (TPR) repeat protein
MKRHSTHPRLFRVRLLGLAVAAAGAVVLAGCATTSEAPELKEAHASALYGDFLAGRYADMTRDPQAAANRYFQALSLAPKDKALLQHAIEGALAINDPARAASAARMAKDAKVDLPLARLTLATLDLAQDHPAAARQKLGEIDSGGPFDRLALRTLYAWSLVGEGKIDAAIAAVTPPQAPAPFTHFFDDQRAMMLDYAGRDEAAAAAYAEAASGGVHVAAAAALNARLLHRMGRKDEAIALYEAQLANSDDPVLAADLAAVRRGAPPVGPRLTRASQGAAIGLSALVGLLAGQADPNFYLSYLTLAMTLDPHFDAARLVYGAALREIDQPDAALRALDTIPPGASTYESAQVQRAWILHEQGRDDQGIAAARAAAASGGKLSRMALADLYRTLERWSDAEPLYEALIEEDKQDAGWRLYFARGAVRERLGQWPAAEADLKHSVALSAEQAEVLNYLGYSWIDRGEHLKQGLALIEKAASLEPQSGYIVDSLGWAHLKLGDLDTAVDYLEQAVELTPDDPTLNDHLGDAYWKVGRKTEARFQWRRALTLKPSDADKATIETKLAKGMPAAHPARTAQAEAPR